MSDTICIVVPPRNNMSKVVHLATTAVASRAGLNIDQADDLNTGLDELFRMSVASDHGGDSFCVRYEIHSDRLEVTAEGIDPGLVDDSSKVSRYRKFILEKVADRFEQQANQTGDLDILLVKFIKS